MGVAACVGGCGCWRGVWVCGRTGVWARGCVGVGFFLNFERFQFLVFSKNSKTKN